MYFFSFARQEIVDTYFPNPGYTIQALRVVHVVLVLRSSRRVHSRSVEACLPDDKDRGRDKICFFPSLHRNRCIKASYGAHKDKLDRTCDLRIALLVD